MNMPADVLSFVESVLQKREAVINSQYAQFLELGFTAEEIDLCVTSDYSGLPDQYKEVIQLKLKKELK